MPGTLHVRIVAVAGALALAGCGSAGSVSSGAGGTAGASTTGSSAATTATVGSASSTTGTAGSTSSSASGAAGTSTGATTTTTTTTTTTGSGPSTTTGSSATTSAGTTGGDCCGGVCTGSGESCDPGACRCVSAKCITGSGGPIPADAIDLTTVSVLDSPDVSGWPATTALTELDLEASGAHLVFDKQDGASRWPDYATGAGPVQYTLWLFENIGGQWYAAAGIRYAHGDFEQGGAPSGYGAGWFYDPSRWGVMANRQPAVGELVGFMVTAGDERNSGGTDVQERSNVVLVPFPADTGVAFGCAGQAGTVTGGSTGGTTGSGSSTGTSGGTGGYLDCCSGACQAPAQFCDPELCQCAAQGSFDLARAQVYDSPPDIATWPATTSITSLAITGADGFAVTFDKQGFSCDYNGGAACDGSGATPVDGSRWPDVCIPGWNGGNLQYTLWSVEYVGGAWATSGPIEFWCGLASSGGAPSSFAADWYYDARWGPLMGHQPAVGEWVGFFVSAGNARNITSDDPSQSTVMERSNVVFVPFPADAPGASFTF